MSNIENLTIMFTDIVGYSEMVSSLSRIESERFLHRHDQLLQKVIKRFGGKIIKTIGDAYMCVGGMPTEDPDHALNVVKAALEMQKVVEEQKEVKANENRPVFSIRVGVHSGPVVAGVVGTKKFAYDIWGDTVNQAARLEASGEPGRVAVSATVASRISAVCNCTPAGTFTAKNIGEMERFWVESGEK